MLLKQNPGEMLVQLDPAAADSTTEIQTRDSGTFSLSRKVNRRSGFFVVQPPVQVSEESSQSAIDALNADSRVLYAYPAFVNPETGKRVFLNDEIVVCFNETLTNPWNAVESALGLKLTETLSVTDRIYVYRIADPKNTNPFRVCQTLLSNQMVAWSEPNFTQEGQALGYPPNDTLLSSLWHLRNTGQQALAGADVKAYDAWAGEKYGSTGIRIAILDSGVDTDHAELDANAVAGYDFKDGDADPRPATAHDNHGTPVAGVAAAEVDNNTGVAGVAGKCKILPVRIAQTTDAAGTLEFASDTVLYRAFVYAADNADVLNCSWKLATSSSTVSSAISYANSNGRGGKGCAVMVAAGGDASGHGSFSWEGDVIGLDLVTPFGVGTRSIEFSYEKNGSVSAGDDAVWLAEIYVPLNGQSDYDVFTFDSGTFSGTGWTAGGHAGFTLNSGDPAHTHGTTRYALKSGAITHGQNSRLQSPLLDINSTTKPGVFFRRWMSSEFDNDNLVVYVKNQSGNTLGSYTLGGGQVSSRNTAVAFPADLTAALAVGASTDFDYRADYSAIGSTLDFVAPAAGGYASRNTPFWDIDGIRTTDRSGSAGYVADDYTDIWGSTTPVGGTSMSSAIAAGVAALVLSKDGNLSRATLTSKLIDNCNKVGPVTYSGSPSRNDYYGHGRLNADASVDNTTADTTAPTFSSATVLHRRAVDVVFNEPMGDGVLNPNNYTITAGKNTLSDNPVKVLRIGLIQVGFGSCQSVFRLIWDSGDMATSGTVTIAASSSIKDVAGNAVTGTLSRSSTGTKRLLAVNGGSPDALNPSTYAYTVPFIADNGFQGNEAAVLLTSSGTGYSYTDSSVSTSGITDPAPQTVYRSRRTTEDEEDPITITYRFAGMPNSGDNIVRLHFTDFWDIPGLENFDIYINDTYKGSYTSGSTSHKAYVYEYSNIGLNGNGLIEIDLVPSSSYYDY